MEDSAEEQPSAGLSWTLEEGARRTLLHDLALIHEDDPIGHLPRESHLVRHHDHRHSRVSQLAHDVQHLLDHLRVEGGGRLHEAGCEKLFEEKTSGARRKRPEFEPLLAELRADGVVVVTRLDRLARSTSELLRIAETIVEKNGGLQSIAEPWADTTTPAGRMVLTVFAGIAEFERSLIATRTEEGRRAAQARGVSFGRPPKLRPNQRTLARNLIEEGKSVSDVARTFNVHVATIYRCLHDEATL